MGSGMIGTAGYVMCPDGLQAILTDGNGATIGGGSVQINSASQTSGSFPFNSSFVFDIDVTVPCEFEGQTIVLKLIFCDENGNPVCFKFPLILSSCSLECDTKDGSPDPRTRPLNENMAVSMFPNPASQVVTIRVSGDGDIVNQVMITDLLGKQLNTEKFIREINISTQQLNNGLYIVKILNGSGEVLYVNKLIVYKY